MKKKLEADLISIAHRILKLKNKSDLVQLHQETQKLYEKLSVLRFVEEHLGDVKPTIGQTAIEEKITAAFESVAEEIKAEDTVEPEVPAVIEEPKKESTAPKSKSEKTAETEPQSEPEAQEIQEEPASENQEPEIEEKNVEVPAAEVEKETPAEVETEEKPAAEFDQPAELAGEMPQQEEAEEAETPEPEKHKEPAKAEDSPFKPAFELSFDASEEAPAAEVKEDAKDEFKTENTQITFEDIMGSHYADPVFVKAEDLDKERAAAPTPDNVIPIGRNFTDSPVISIHKADDSKSYSLNERLSKGITIGLNDRIAFMKHLFSNSSEDYNRVLSQLMTFDTFDEAKNFIDNMVKPDYNNWDGKDEYAERFMEIVEKKFS